MTLSPIVSNEHHKPVDPRDVCLAFDQQAAANQERRGRAVAKEEVWLRLRVAAIQQQWLKRLDWRSLPPTLSVEFELFRRCSVREERVTALRERLLGVSRDRR